MLARNPPLSDLEIGERRAIEEGSHMEIVQRIEDIGLTRVDLSDEESACLPHTICRHGITFRASL
jgi:hypothetical protein